MYKIFFFISVFFLFAFRAHPGTTGGRIICDTVPTGVPQYFGGPFYQFAKYLLADSMLMMKAGDTNAIPRYPALKFKSSDNRWYGHDRTRWRSFLYVTDTAAMLSNYINQAGYGLIKNGQLVRADTGATGLATQYDLTQIASTLQEVMDNGNVTNRTYYYDSIATATDGNPTSAYPFIINPLDRTGSPPPFTFALGATKYPGITRRDNVALFGWNLNAGGGPYQAGEPGIGFALEQLYIPIAGDTNTEAHLYYLTKAGGIQKRLFSYTIKEYLGTYDFYHTVSRLYLKNPSNEQQYFIVQPSSTGASLTLLESASTNNVKFEYDNTFGLTLTSSAGSVMMYQGFQEVIMPGLQLKSNIGELRVTDGQTLLPDNDNMAALGFNNRRWSNIFSYNMHAATNISVSGLTPIYSADINITKNVNGSASVNIENTSTGTSAHKAINFVEASDKVGGFLRYNTNFSGNFTGTSIPFSQAFQLYNNTGASPASIPVVLSGTPICGIPGTTSTNLGFRQDATGFRIDQIQNLHTANTNAFHVVGTIRMVDGNQAAGKVMTSDINGEGTWQTPASVTTLYTGNGTADNRTVTVTGNDLTFTSALTGLDATMAINNSSTGRGLNVSVLSGVGIVSVATTGIGILGQSTDGVGVWGASTNSNGIYAESPVSTGAAQFVSNPATSNTTHEILDLRRINSAGAGAANIAGAIDVSLNNTTGAGSVTKSLRLISKLTTATTASEVSDFEVWGLNSGTLAKKLSLEGSGQLVLDGYTTDAFTGTPTNSLQSTSTGRVIQGPIIASGTWTATLTAVTNVDGTPTLTKAHYTRIGNEVTYSIEVVIDATATTTVTEVRFSLPIASNLAAAGDIIGALSGETTGTAAVSGHVETDTANDEGRLQFTSQSVNNHTITVTGHYSII